jgi:choline dehydrogenase-like flavoprotein
MALAGREIVLSGGAINSPQLLLLSGIGPADELRALGIDPLHDLPGVGRNLAEHPNIINEYELKQDLGLTRHLRFDRAARAALRWRIDGGGPFAQSGTLANLFARSTPGLDRPDLQIMFLPMSGDARMWLPGQSPFPARLSARCGFLHPLSRGSVTLRSTDPRAAPRIHFNMFGQPGDLDGMVRALELCRSIYARSPLRELISHEVKPPRGVDNLAEFIRRNALTGALCHTASGFTQSLEYSAGQVRLLDQAAGILESDLGIEPVKRPRDWREHNMEVPEFLRRLALELREDLLTAVAQRWRELGALETVWGELAEEFGGEDPVSPELRSLADGTKQRLRAMAEEFGGRRRMTGPDEDALSEVRNHIEAAFQQLGPLL